MPRKRNPPNPHQPTPRSIHIVARGEEFYVVPPAIVLAPGDTVKIVNHTTEDLAWIVTDDSPFGNAVMDKVEKGHSSGRQTVASGTALGAFDYQVLMLGSGKKAKGHSDPMIIIDTEP